MRRALAVLLAAVAGFCVACGAPAVDKAGAPIPQQVVRLSVGVSDPGDAAFRFLIDAVSRTSEGRIRLDVDATTYFSQTPGGEQKLAGALQAGTVDLAYLPSRDWAETGDHGFRAVQSPFLVTTTEATVALAGSEMAGELLRSMSAHGAIGIGLVPAQPRRLVTRFPVVEQNDLAGARIRINDNSQTASMVAAMGGQAVQGMTDEVRTELEAGKLEGVEAPPRYVAENSFNVAAPYLTTFGLIPKLEVVAASTAAWSRLTDADRRALVAAVAETTQREAAQLERDESRDLSSLCANGLVLVRPAPGALESWRDQATEAAPPDHATAAFIDRLVAAVPGLGPRPMASDLPAACHLATSAAQARVLQEKAAPSAVRSSADGNGTTIPPGTYVVTVTVEQWRSEGLQGRDNSVDITFTWTFRRDGTFYETQEPDFPTQGPMSGRYSGRGDVVTLTYDPSPTGSLPPETVRWTYLRGTLTFEEVSLQDQGARAIYKQPWHKVS